MLFLTLLFKDVFFSEDSTVAVFGCGAIGLGVIATSKLVGASRIFAIDTNPEKKSVAMDFGATDFVNPLQLPEGTRIQDHLIALTDGGLDFTFDCTGNVGSSPSFYRRPLSDCFLGECDESCA
jgi:Zn-dependent alcohol dehydrogenase